MEVKAIPKIIQKEFLASRFTKLNFWPLAVGAIDAKKILKTNDIKILSLGSGQNKNKIDGDTSTKWGGVGWLRNDIMGMLLDSEIHNDISNDYQK